MPTNERCEKLYDLNFNHPNSKSYETHPPCNSPPYSHSQAAFSQILTFSLAFSSFSLFFQFLPINSEKFFFPIFFLQGKKPNNVNTHNYYCVKSMIPSQLHMTIYQCLYLLNSGEVQESLSESS